jgi:peptide/nickel transport system substrate-binding protein
MTRILSRRALLLMGGSSLIGLAAACSSAAPGAPTSPPAAAKPTSAPAATTAPAAAKPTTAPATTTSAPAAQPTAAAAATSGGTVTLPIGADPTLNPWHPNAFVESLFVNRVLFGGLTKPGKDLNPAPDLAASWKAADNGMSWTFTLRDGVQWSDGQPFTADDVVYTWQWIMNPANASVSSGVYGVIKDMKATDPHTVDITFTSPTANWFLPHTGTTWGYVYPKHVLGAGGDQKAANDAFLAKPTGTGPYKVDSFSPNDQVIYSVNDNFRDANSPYFAKINLKGGGDATSAARAVLETGDYDYAWNLQVEAPVLNQMLQAGKGDLVTAPGSGVEQILFNMTDPNTEVDGERSSPKSQHPFLVDQRVRQAMALAIDRDTMAKTLYGQTGDATANVLTTPTNLSSKNTAYEFNIDKANQILDEAGYKKGGDGIRMTPQGVRMKVIYQTSINSLRQKEQALVKDGWQKIGIDTELKSVDAGVYFGTDPGNPDTTQHFYTDVEMFTSTFDTPFPQHYMERWYSGNPDIQFAQKSNNWTGQNYSRWKNDDYNKVYDQVKSETDVQKATQLWMQLNDIVVNSYISVPLIDRKFSDAKSKGIKGPDPGPFDAVYAWNVADWTRG